MATVNGTKPISNRTYTITAADDGYLLELGPAATHGNVGAYVIQFNPSLSWNGAIQVQNRVFGTASQALSMPFVPCAYRLVSLNGIPSAAVNGQLPLVSDLILGAAQIQVPANGFSIALLVSCTQGDCPVVSWDLQGSSAI